ncbi:hypothetical protein [Rhizobium leguminosarum]|uniref:hypothetical protein n=1 Tax=Rhizobium leguminosarum TaxID=384 RepID=UPI001C945720|nr:hypothetical protein [Rhizobium leguminosarum]MBY5658299.1 hypothetical protein [Rhizobium leguminosarum]
MDGLEEFRRVLKEYSSLALWAAGGSVIIPFVASFLSIIPPWPPRLDVITAVFQLLFLVFSYQNFKGSNKKRATRYINLCIFGCIFSIVTYILLFSNFTIFIPEKDNYIVVGYRCTTEALEIKDYAGKCPFLERDELKAASYVEHKLWTRGSISVVRTALIAIWFVFFSFLATALGVFIVFQMGRLGRVPQRPKPG